MLAMLELKLPPQAAQQRQDEHGGVGRGVVLHRKANADGRDQQRGGGDGCPAAAATSGTMNE